MKALVFARLILAFIFVVTQSAALADSRVVFDTNGIAQVDGKPFFPVGVFTYEMNPEVLAELRELRCNTVLNGFATNQLDLIQQHGLMAVCFADPPWIQAAQHHPALLGWYLADEPEGRLKPEDLRKRYSELKARDPNHPIGLCHTVYEARRVHGKNWPQWTYIQTFGGSETDNGIWAVPLPHEVRFMVYQALVHRATGLLYFSYWPRQPRLWQSISTLNREVQQLVPRLVASGRELTASAGTNQIQVRARVNLPPSNSGGTNSSGVIIAINTAPRFVQTEVAADCAPSQLDAPFENRTVHCDKKGRWRERFEPYGVHVYTWGTPPEISLAREN